MRCGRLKISKVALVICVALLSFAGKIQAQYDFTWSDTCQYDTTKFVLNDPTGVTTILWDFGDAGSVPPSSNQSNLLNPTHVFSFNGYFTVTLTINGAEVKRHTVVINPLPKISDVFTIVCKGITITMKTDTGNKMKHYLWNTGDVSQSITFTLVKDTIFRVRNYDYKECYRTATFRVKALAINANFDINQILQCLTTNYYSFTTKADTAMRPWLKFEWDFGDGNASNMRHPAHTYGAAGNYTINVKVYPQDTAACAENFSKDVKVISQVKPDFDYVVDHCNNMVRTINKSADAISYTWDFNGTRYFNKKDTFIYFKAKGSYPVTLLTNAGTDCADSTTKYVDFDAVDTAMFIPSAFSPNKDEVNDLFQMLGLDYSCFKYTLYIFDRWGEKVFDSGLSDTAPSWDGTYHGTTVPPGIYFYLIKGKTFKRYGSLSIVY